jgi:hypothetical protein
MKGPPPKPNMDETIASKNAPIHPKMMFTLNSCPQNSTIIFCAPYFFMVRTTTDFNEKKRKNHIISL